VTVGETVGVATSGVGVALDVPSGVAVELESGLGVAVGVGVGVDVGLGDGDGLADGAGVADPGAGVAVLEGGGGTAVSDESSE
jgi:hypothetical protein